MLELSFHNIKRYNENEVVGIHCFDSQAILYCFDTISTNRSKRTLLRIYERYLPHLEGGIDLPPTGYEHLTSERCHSV